MTRSLNLGALACGVGFIAYATLSIAWSSSLTWWPGLYWATVFLAALAGYAISSMRMLWLIACVALSLNLLGSLIEQHVFGIWGAYGLLGNPNYLGVAMVMATAAALVYDFWWFLPFGVLGLLWIQSRGALLAGAIVLAVWCIRKSPFIAYVIFMGGIILILGFSSGRELPIMDRLGLWQDTLNHIIPFGHGLGAFYDDWNVWLRHTGMGFQRPPHVYNDFLEVLYDFGFGAIMLWFLYIIAYESRRDTLILTAFLACGISYFPLYIPIIGHFGAAALGHLLADLPTRKETTNGKMACYTKALPSR